MTRKEFIARLLTMGSDDTPVAIDALEEFRNIEPQEMRLLNGSGLDAPSQLIVVAIVEE